MEHSRRMEEQALMLTLHYNPTSYGSLSTLGNDLDPGHAYTAYKNNDIQSHQQQPTKLGARHKAFIIIAVLTGMGILLLLKDMQVRLQELYRYRYSPYRGEKDYRETKRIRLGWFFADINHDGRSLFTSPSSSNTVVSLVAIARGGDDQKYGILPEESCKATIMIIGDCEVDGEVPEHHCNHVLGGLIHDNKDLAPSFIFAEKFPQAQGRRAPQLRSHNNKIRQNFKEHENTALGQWAEKFDLDVNTDYDSSSEDLARHLRHLVYTGEMCGKVAVVFSWKHNDIGKLASKLGCEPEQGCPITTKNDDNSASSLDEQQVWQLQVSLSQEAAPKWHIFGSVVEFQGFDPNASSSLPNKHTP